jgi:hypothetical protein
VNTNSGRGGLLILGGGVVDVVGRSVCRLQHHVAGGSFRLARKILGRDTPQFPSGDKPRKSLGIF